MPYFRIKKIDSKFDDFKIIIAAKISKLIVTEIKQSEKADADRKLHYDSKNSPEFVKKLMVITEKMKEISSKFHVIKT
ncbi:MAG: hypothetical protein NWF10_07525 [Candidatus Bathyarchaeota archaeon]|nr:hypothetical protein [Candidatus Bathyarchaeota archaeon]